MDARISDVIVILDQRYEGKRDEAVSQLKACGLDIRDADDGNSVIEGTIDMCKVHELEKLDSVDYVRTVFTYYANYPVGDPRDLDGV